MTDISVILPGESKYEIKFCRQVTNLLVMIDFMQKMHVFETAIFDILALGPPPTSSNWLILLNQYIFRKYIPWPCSSFLNFSEIFYSKKVFFVPLRGVKS